MNLSHSIPEEYRALAARLRSAEDQIFPLLMVDPDRYQRAVTLIGLLADFFVRRATSLPDLEDARTVAVANARDLASRNAVVTADLDLEVVADAAMSQRFRQLLVHDARAQADSRMDEARRAGLAWITVSEPDFASLGITPEQEWVDVHISSGTELVRTISMDFDTGSPIFRISLSGPNGPELNTLSAGRQEWLRAAEEVREMVEARHLNAPGVE